MSNTADDAGNSHWVSCYVGLGSNLSNELGSPIDHIERALTNMQGQGQIRELQASSFYASAPMGPQDQPDFVNAVASFETTLSPFALLAYCQQLEALAKRARIRRWGERSLDVDILLYGDLQMTDPQLTIPHAEMSERNFVLIPLRELTPTLTIAGIPIADYPQSNDWAGLTLLSCD